MALIYIPFTAFVVQAIFASCGENMMKIIYNVFAGMAEVREPFLRYLARLVTK